MDTPKKRKHTIFYKILSWSRSLLMRSNRVQILRIQFLDVVEQISSWYSLKLRKRFAFCIYITGSQDTSQRVSVY